jgi:hypothetical protein
VKLLEEGIRRKIEVEIIMQDNKSRIQLEVAVSSKTPGEVVEAHYRIEEATK